MLDPSNLEAYRAMSSFGHALATIAETTKGSPTPLVLLHARFAGGLVATYDEGSVTFAHEDIGQLTLLEIDEAIAALGD